MSHRHRPSSTVTPDRGAARAKYAALAAKYEELVRCHERDSARSTSATLLALAAMRASETGLAAIRDGQYVVRNSRWAELDVGRQGSWRIPGAARQAARQTTLDALALERASQLVDGPDRVWTIRYEQGDADPVVEIRLERIRLDPNGAPLILAMASDVTATVRGERDMARMRDALEVQERLRALGELASGLAHDLNNTLHALRLRLARVSACVAGCPEHADDIRVIERIAADAGTRIRRLQDLARRREDVPNEHVDLASVIADAAAVARDGHDAQRAEGRLSIEVQVPELPLVVGNPSELGHVVVNLLLNARDAMPDGGRVVIAGSVGDDGFVEITVADEGTGIPSENLKRIFDPFFTTKGRRGTGLGLSIAAGVARRLGGSIRADNRPGGGAVFTLRLPAASDDEAQLRPAAERIQPAADARPCRVLVVDDDPDNLDAMRLVLAQDGHDVEVTDMGTDAVARVGGGAEYDLVLCDLGLGDITGWDVAARIRSIAPSTRVVLVTGWAEEIARDDPHRQSVARVVSKPLGAEDLRALVAESTPEPPARPATPTSDPRRSAVADQHSAT